MDEVRGFNQNSSHSWGWKTLGANSDLEKEMLSWAREAGFAFEELECLMNSFSIVTNNYNTMYNGTRYPSPMVLAAIFLSISTLECVSSLSCSLFLLLGLLHIMAVTKRTSPSWNLMGANFCYCRSRWHSALSTSQFPQLLEGVISVRVSYFTVDQVSSTMWVAEPGLNLQTLWQPLAVWCQRTAASELGLISARAHVFLSKFFQRKSRFPSHCRLLKRQTNKFSTICQCRSPAATWHCLWFGASSSNPVLSQSK